MTEEAVMTVKRLTLRFCRKSFPLLLICIAFLLSVRIWRVWNDINVNINSMNLNPTSSLGGETRRQFTALLLSSNATERPIVKQHIHQTKLLSTVICPTSLYLLILVSTNVGNFDRRQLIRKTWGAQHSIDTTEWKTVFLLGKNSNEQEMKTAKKESDIYGDMVHADYHEHFWNMSYKVAMGFEWSVKYCSFHYLLKSDDDVFVNTFGVMDYLSKFTTPRKKLYTGNIMVGSVVLRRGRYGVSPQEYNGTFYKPYCSGGGYILSRDVVEKFMGYFDFLRPLKIDDAYIGVLANRAGIKVIHNSDFRMYEDKCDFKASTLVQHPARGDCVIKLYDNMIEKILG